jgi:hypothetical protein
MFKERVKLFVAIAVATLVLNTTGNFEQAEKVYVTVMNWGRRKQLTGKPS